MAFRFSLAAVLILRESIEEREFLELESIQRNIAGIKLQIEQAGQRERALAENRSGELVLGLPGGTLQCLYEQEEGSRQYRASLESQSLELESIRKQRTESYQKARRDRETLTTLQKRQLEEYRKRELRREQNTLDDIFLSRFNRPE